jgi:transcriptional regulator with XRE-family HTH domain
MSRQEQLQKIIGRCIAKKRGDVRLTQEEVAYRLHMSTEAYGRYERGATPVTLPKLARIAAIFQCGLDELMVETSTGLTAQAQKIANLLDGLSSSDRDEVVAIVEKVCEIAHKKYKKQPPKPKAVSTS